ncbi:MAG: hypothetical protein IKO74_08265 [Selenomonadaceae bacterium]|nr:hypothetical protein [Selenomonadaceae bacterium]
MALKEMYETFGNALLGDKMKNLERMKEMRDEFRTYDNEKLIDLYKNGNDLQKRIAAAVLKERNHK